MQQYLSWPDYLPLPCVIQVPVSDNYYAALNSAVFSDGSFVYVPKGVKSPMELSTYFRINASETGQVGNSIRLHVCYPLVSLQCFCAAMLVQPECSFCRHRNPAISGVLLVLCFLQ